MTPAKAKAPSLPPIPRNKFLDSIYNNPVMQPAAITKLIDGVICALDIPTKAPQ